MGHAPTDDSRFVFIDLETTGLDPETGLILEAAIVITDKHLDEIDSLNVIVAHTEEELTEHLDQYTTQMHMKNGLITDIAALRHLSTDPGVAHMILDGEMVGFLDGHGISNVPMAGSSIAFDRAWINRHAPLTAKSFHYRNIDVSSMREALKRINPKMNPNIPQIGTAHRAMGDILTTIETLRVIAKISGWRY